MYGKNESTDGNEIHEIFYKKNAYKTGTGFKFPSFSSSSSSSSSGSSSGSNYGNNPSLSSSYSQSSSYSSGLGGSINQPAVQLAPYGQQAQPICSTKPKSILNASTKCNLGTNTCMVQCLNSYRLPNGETMAKMICNNGEWVLEKLDWTEKLACERKINYINSKPVNNFDEFSTYFQQFACHHVKIMVFVLSPAHVHARKILLDHTVNLRKNCVYRDQFNHTTQSYRAVPRVAQLPVLKATLFRMVHQLQI